MLKCGLKNTWKVFWNKNKPKIEFYFLSKFFLLNFVKFHNNILNSFANNIFICNQCYCYLYYNWTINIIYDQDTKRNGCYLNGIVCCEYLKEMFAVKSLEILKWNETIAVLLRWYYYTRLYFVSRFFCFHLFSIVSISV